MVIKIYAMDVSPPVRAVKMCCEVFTVPYENVEVNLLEKSNLDPEYVKKNPVATIPILEDGDFIIHDSHAILTYLAGVFGKEDSWYPKDLKKRAHVDQKLFFNASVLFPRLRAVTFPLVVEGNKNISQESLDKIEQTYDYLNKFLSKTAYVAADHVTIADLAVLSNLSSMIHLVPLDEKKYPNTAAWLAKMNKEPFVIKCNKPGADCLGEAIRQSLA